jgi:E3 ubiquitin-protein ligase RNF217
MTESNYILETSNKYGQCLPPIVNDFFPKPTTKLEQIENLILIPSTSDATFINTNTNNINNSNNNNNNSINANFNNNTSNMVLSSTNNINAILNNNSSNNIFDADNKIISLQRSISDKLRNSFKTNSNKINTNNILSANINTNQKNANSSYPILTLTRKWHSERYKNRKIQLNLNNVNNSQNNDSNGNQANKLFKFSSQMNPLNSHYKAILAQYTNKNKSILCSNSHKNKLNVKPAKSLEIQSKNKILFGLTKSSNKSNENSNKIKFLLTGGKDKENSNNNTITSSTTNNNNSLMASKTSSTSCNKSSNAKKLLFSKKPKNNSSKNNIFFESNNDYAGINKINSTNDYLDDTGDLNGVDEDDSTTDDEEFNYLLKQLHHNRHHHYQHYNHTIDSSDESDQDDYLYTYNQKSKRSNNLTRSHSYSMGDKNNKNSLLLNNSNQPTDGINISDKPMSSKTSNQFDFLYHHDSLTNSNLINRRLANNEQEDFYERVTSQKHECQICFDKVYLNERLCCKFRACNNCINYYIETKIKNSCGLVKIECLNTKCAKLIHRDEICERMSHYDKNTLKNYLKYLVEANKDSNCKTCPRCSHIMRLDDYKLKTVTSNNSNISNEKARSSSFSGMSLKMSKSKNKSHTTKNNSVLTKVQCIECQLIWCFQCHAPWHDGITCNEFRKGDRMLKYWAKEVHFGQQNAQLCPKCKIYIQRTKGCDHMVCTYCQTEFCYKCGGKFRRFKFIGNINYK